ncbi:MAG: T9SS type A sorting domain-containing protein, partial [Candidatus Lokiarchaeota archaeon]|nr:T9SS type A sorting domain-containing protein [Candidatus Lokiarchaeota archaeon]
FKFEFDTQDNIYNNYRGWYVDDVKVEAGNSNASLALFESVNGKNEQMKNDHQSNIQSRVNENELSAAEIASINENVTLTGLQIPTSGGTIKCKLISGSQSGTANVTAQSVEGNAKGQVNVTIIGNSNLALNCEVTSSSNYSNSYTGSNAVDGNTYTYWRSENGTSSDHFEWIFVSLNTQYNINKVVVDWHSSYYAAYYTIQTWDGSKWVIQQIINNGAGGIETVQLNTPIMAQHIAIGCEQPNSSSNSYGIDEFEVYASNTTLANNESLILQTTNPTHSLVKSVNLLSDTEIDIQNFPNPFNPTTIFRFNLPKSSFVTLKIYSLLGQQIETLINDYRPAGEYEVKWNAIELPSGMYFYCLEFEGFSKRKKLILMK